MKADFILSKNELPRSADLTSQALAVQICTCFAVKGGCVCERNLLGVSARPTP